MTGGCDGIRVLDMIGTGEVIARDRREPLTFRVMAWLEDHRLRGPTIEESEVAYHPAKGTCATGMFGLAQP